MASGRRESTRGSINNGEARAGKESTRGSINNGEARDGKESTRGSNNNGGARGGDGPTRGSINNGGARGGDAARMMRFSRRFNVFVASAVAVYFLGALFGRANYVMIAAVLLAYGGREWWRCRGGLDGLVVRVDAPGQVVAGSSVGVTLALRSDRRLQCVEVGVELDRSEDDARGVLVDDLPGGQERREQVELAPLPRGVWSLATVAVAVHGELGLIRRSEDRPLGQPLVAYPEPMEPRTVVPPPLEPAETLGVLPGPLSPTGPMLLRPFASGDSARRVHWRATARLGQLVILHSRVGPQARVLLLVDTGCGEDLERVLAVASWALEEAGDGRRRVLALAGDGPESVSFDEADPLSAGRERLARAKAGSRGELTRFLTRMPRKLAECEVRVICAAFPHVPSLEGYPVGFYVAGRAAMRGVL